MRKPIEGMFLTKDIVFVAPKRGEDFIVLYIAAKRVDAPRGELIKYIKIKDLMMIGREFLSTQGKLL